MVFIGGRNITFRSFNSLDTKFHDDYQKNTTELCTIPPIEPNVNANAEMIIGITDKVVLKTFFENIGTYSDLTVFKTLKLRWNSATGSSSMDIKKDSNGNFPLDSITLMNKILVKGQTVDNLINIALNDFDSLKKQGNFKRGVIMVFADKKLNQERDAGREFDHRNGYYMFNDVELFEPKNSVNVTVFMNILNYYRDEEFSSRALSHVSLGSHYFEANNQEDFIVNVKEMKDIIIANLSERCDTEKCNGFCDGRNRCTCPMCCENDCYYTYCETTTGTCTPWPKANPKMKIICDNQDKCGNIQECKDGYGCIIKQYAPECEPQSKCNTTDCDSTTGLCKYVDRCTRDTVPHDGKCYNYICVDGECVRDQAYATCPDNDNPCVDLVCTDTSCVKKDKVCVKTAPYSDMDCYKAYCVNGECVTKLDCEKYSVCSDRNDITTGCYCNSTSSYKCKCEEPKLPEGVNKSKVLCGEGQQCDYTLEHPECKTTKCKRDLYSKSCKIEYCNETTGVVQERDYDCSSKLKEVIAKCRDFFEAVCEGDNKCVLRDKETGELTGTHKIEGECDYCVLEIDGTVKVTDDECPGMPVSPAGAHMYCDNGECKYEEVNCTEYFLKIMGDEQCPIENFHFEFDAEYGECIKSSDSIPECTVCENKEFKQTCNGIQKIELSYEFTEDVASSVGDDKLSYEKTTVKIEYVIPKICMNDNCVAVPRLCDEGEVSDSCIDDKEGKYPDFYSNAKCEALLKEKGFTNCEYTAKYIYPQFFSAELFKNDKKQKSDFYKVVNDMAKCEFTLTRKPCGACLIGKDGQDGQDHQLCKEDEDTIIDAFKYRCNRTTDQCEIQTVACPTNETMLRQCKVRVMDEGYNCIEEFDDICAENRNKTIQYEEAAKNKSELSCIENECQFVSVNVPPKCPIWANNTRCEYEYLHRVEGRPFGCSIPFGICDPVNYTCKFKNLTSIFDELELEEYKVDKDGNKIETNDKCITYKCEEDGKGGHYWAPLENKHENVVPNHKCETAYCDPTTGEIVRTEKQCSIEQDFPDMPPSAVKCNTCECNYKDGKMTLIVNPDTEDEKYSFDACGNCIVTDKYGNENNFNATCVLNDEVKIDGVIAGAVTVGVVVVAVTVSLVVVGIGALQTFQLVSSAMKNTV